MNDHLHCPSAAGLIPRATYIPFATLEVVIIKEAAKSSTATRYVVDLIPIGKEIGLGTLFAQIAIARMSVFQNIVPP